MTLSRKTSQCPVCRRTGHLILDLQDESYGTRFALHACTACKVGYTYPCPTDEELRKIYSGEYWARETTLEKRGGLARRIQSFNNIRLAMMIRPLVNKLDPGMSILEVGCGSGHLAAYLSKCGFEVEVTDIDESILEEIDTRHAIKGYCGDLTQIDFMRNYHAVIFNNVLEHLPSPGRALEIAAGLLHENGVIFIEVPNINSYQFKVFKAHWFHLVIPQHLYHFSAEALDTLASRFSLHRIWQSTFSPKTSAAGYAASLSPVLQPANLRKNWSKAMIFIYLGLQVMALPLVGLETVLGRGAVLRVLYQKKRTD